MKEMVGGCCVCSDERGWPENPLVYCDGASCNVAVHQACYGIVTVPTGPWYCRKCESQERSARVRCELCPSRTGALKKTNTSGWAHVVCALYIPEVRFGNVTTMEPINLDSIPVERYGKTCYICQEMNKGSRATMGACMQCNKTGCRQQFHVTCAQQLGLLCEEAGNYLDNVKYCGYCQHHYSKLKKGGNVKLIPPYKPITYETGSSDGPSSPEKESETTTTSAGGPTMAGGSGSMGPAAISMSSTGGGLGVSGESSLSQSSNASLPAAAQNSTSTLSSSASKLPSSSSLAISVAASTATPAGMNSSSGPVASSMSTGPSSSSVTGGGAPAPPSSSSASSSSSSSKNRKSSSASKGPPSSSSSSSASAGASNNHQGGGSGTSGAVSTSSTAVGSSSTSSGSNANGSGKTSSTSGTGSGSSKEYKEKHGKSTSRVSNSKERDSYKESKSNKSSSSSSSSKSKESSSSSSHHHHSHSESPTTTKNDHRSADKVSGSSTTTGGGSSSSNKNMSSASILAPSVLQATAISKDAAHKLPYVDGNPVAGMPADLTGNSHPDAVAAAFGNEIKLAGSSNSSSGAPVSSKKRKASDSSKLQAAAAAAAALDERAGMKDVSVTLIPLRPYDKSEGGQEAKKVKPERGSPLQTLVDQSSHQHGPAAASSSLGGALASNNASSANLLATQTGATSISITKQPPAQSASTTNVIIKPPIIKDIVGHLSAASSVAVASANNSGGPSLVVSVPLSPVSGATGLGLATSMSSASVGGMGSVAQAAASQNLFQQAIQNRSEHLNFSSRNSNSAQVAAMSRVSPVIAGGGPVGGGGHHHHHGGDHLATMHQRQSPLIQASSLNIDNGGRSSLSPSIQAGNAIHQSDSGMLKITYEKQAVHSAIVNAGGNSNRLSALQDDAMSSGRRSSPDCGLFQSAMGAKGGALFPTMGPTKRVTREHAAKSNICHVGGGNVVKHTAGDSEKHSYLSPSSSNLFSNAAAVTAQLKSSAAASALSSSAAASTATACPSTSAPFSSFITSSRTPDFSYASSFSGVPGSNIVGGGGGGGGGLKISYEAQMPLAVTTAATTTLLTPSPSPSMSQMGGQSTTIAPNTIGAQPIVKDSPPSSPSSEAGSSSRKRTRRQDGAGGALANAGGHGKVFQNGIHASHMLGNQLNPNSSVAQKMSDQLHMELEAHSVYTSETSVNLVGPVFPGKQSASAGASAAGAGTKPGQGVQGPPSLSSMLSGAGGNSATGGTPQSLEQLLERQWEQGSQFLMEQAQHFDIASLLSCLHQLRAENVRLEDHVNNLVARRDHLLAVNARLAIPLSQSTGNSSSSGSFNNNSTANGPLDGQPPTNIIQRSGEPGIGSRPSGGGRGGVHGSYPMENGIDFRAAAQQQQQQQQSIIMGGGGGGGVGGHQGSSSGGGGNSAGIVRTSGASGSSTAASIMATGVSVMGGGGGGGGGGCPGNGIVGGGIRMLGNSNHQLSMPQQQQMQGCGNINGSLIATTSSGGGGVLPSQLMGGGGVVGSSMVGGNSSGVVTALSMNAGGASRATSVTTSSVNAYPSSFQHIRRDDAQVKPS